jgi:hypothetical protein
LPITVREEDDPRVQIYRTHPLWGPGVIELGVLLDRYDLNKEVLAIFVWSTVSRIARSTRISLLLSPPLHIANDASKRWEY